MTAIPDDAAELPIGARVKEPGIIGWYRKYAPDRWARTSFDFNDALVTSALRMDGVVVELPDDPT